MDLTQLIKSKALSLGFNKVGIADPNRKLDYIDYFYKWLKSGKNGTMQWINNRAKEREDINNYFPQIKSVISVALNYYTGTYHDYISQDEHSYKFSNYAWGKDYHIIIKEKLNELLSFIQKESKVYIRGLACVDTSPVMEKQWAKQAGIGWQGKNTILLTKEYGSWIFLGELLLDIELDYDEPYAEDLCGNCTACVDSCPVGALSDYGLDASKCISYLTVELKSDFENGQKHDLNKWLYGCDNCQIVCPWNKRSQTRSKIEQFEPMPHFNNYTLKDWMNLNEETFNTLFKKSPVKRIKHKGFIRNAEALLENSNPVD